MKVSGNEKIQDAQREEEKGGVVTSKLYYGIGCMGYISACPYDRMYRCRRFSTVGRVTANVKCTLRQPVYCPLNCKVELLNNKVFLIILRWVTSCKVPMVTRNKIGYSECTTTLLIQGNARKCQAAEQKGITCDLGY